MPRRVNGKLIKNQRSLKRLRTQELMDSSEFWEGILGMIACGMTLKEVNKAHKTHWGSLWKRIKADPDLERRYFEAKEGIGEWASHQMTDLAKYTLNDRVKMESLKILMEKNNPDRYGQRQHIKLEQSVSQQHVDELRELARLKDVTPEVKKIGE